MNNQIYLKDNGSLEEHAIPDLLSIIGKKNLTGMLRIENNQIIKVLYLKEGMISFASSNDPNDRLGEVLINLGKITRAQLEDAIQRLKPNISLGKMLVQLGYLPGKDLLLGAQKQTELIIISLFNWTKGNYSFIEGPLPKQLVDLKMDLNKILYQGILNNSTREWVLKHIGTMQSIFKLKEDEEKIYEKIQMSEEEKSIIPMINGKRTLSEISSSSKLDDFKICKIVAALKLLDFLEKIEIPSFSKEAILTPPEKLTITETKQEFIQESKESAIDIKNIIEEIPAQQASPAQSDIDSKKYEYESYYKKDSVEEIEEEKIDKFLEKQAQLLESEPNDSEEIVSKVSQEFKTEEQKLNPIQEEKYHPISSDDLIFQLTNEESKKKPYLNLIIIGLITISAIIIALVYYIRYKEDNTLLEAKQTISKQIEKKQEETDKSPQDISIVSITKPKESKLPKEIAELKNKTKMPTEITVEEKKDTLQPSQTELAKIKTTPKQEIISKPETVESTKKPNENDHWEIAQSLFKNGNLLNAANTWKNTLKKSTSYYTIQVELACQNETILEAYNSFNDKNKFYLLPKTFQGKQCYIIGYGIFKSKNEATNNYNDLPKILLNQKYPPRIVNISDLIK